MADLHKLSPAMLTAAVVCLLAGSGCSFNQNLNAVPAARVPRDLLTADLKDDFEDISLLRLRQDPPTDYLLGPGDVLGIYIKGVLGDKDELPPVHYPEDSSMPPAVGYPVPIREDGTLALPYIDPLKVEGMSLVDATTQIRNAYTLQADIVKSDRDQIIVTMIRKRTVRVLVIREESGGVEGVSKRGTGHVVDLPAYENDVLHALSETGGMPGTDAKNEVLIYRGMFSDAVNYDALMNGICLDNCQDPCFCNEAPLPDAPNVTRIPLRYHPASPPVFSQQDVILGEGDILIIRSRDDETFFTAGVLGGGEFPLPRDKDLDIIGAIAIAGGPLGSAGTGVGGIGGRGGAGGGGRGGSQFCQPSEAVVIRELPCGNQISIKVDLNKALASRSERILIQPNDVIVLRYTLAEEVGNVMLNLFQFNFLLNGFSGNGF
ncbi:MAG: polysaccharide biosynthesis/export family protein [Planctomyces sp.]|nr:polysaccharide biosynthesis/export family protein [Planctomyces sp.]